MVQTDLFDTELPQTLLVCKKPRSLWSTVKQSTMSRDTLEWKSLFLSISSTSFSLLPFFLFVYLFTYLFHYFISFHKHLSCVQHCWSGSWYSGHPGTLPKESSFVLPVLIHCPSHMRLRKITTVITTPMPICNTYLYLYIIFLYKVTINNPTCLGQLRFIPFVLV